MSQLIRNKGVIARIIYSIITNPNYVMHNTIILINYKP